MADRKKTIQEINKDKYDSVMDTVAWRAGYYRKNPQRFCSEVLDIHLKTFQAIILWAMMNYNFVMFIASRGLGKTFLSAMFCSIRCILFPGSKIIVTAGTLKQASEVLLKIRDELMPMSWAIRAEVFEAKIGQNEAAIYFKNHSWIKACVSTQNARGLRANIIFVDEFRIVNENILNMVIKKFLSNPRHPKYLDNPKYAHLQERNKELYATSAWYQDHWSYRKAQAYTAAFLDDTKKYFICGLPYQTAIKEGLLMRDQVQDEMSESDFNETTWQMEMECKWLGNADNSLFTFEEFNARRKIKKAFFPLSVYTDKMKVPDVIGTNRRILSVDVALMASTKKKKNDASAIYINDLIQVDNTSYQSNFVWGETFEGLTTDELGLIVMRYFYGYKCTDLVIDTNGVGNGVGDYIIKDQYDSETGLTYKALNYCNNDDMAMRCKVKDAPRVVWSIKANAQFNNDICVLLRNGIQNGKINFLIPEQNADEVLRKEYKDYSRLDPAQQAVFKVPYLQTTLAEYELIKLKHNIQNGLVKVQELSGMRKDRYSSIAYNYWCACQLEYQLKPKVENTENLLDMFVIRRGTV